MLEDRDGRANGFDKEFWKKRIELVGGYAYLEFKEENFKVVEDAQHKYAHLFGEVLYEKLGLDGLSVCDDAFLFGCYHSFLGVAIQDQGLGLIHELNQSCLKKYGLAYISCQHGIGHGILTYLGSEKLDDALGFCREIASEEIVGCPTGVFMEFNFNTVNHKERGMRNLDSKGPYFPCNTDQFDYRLTCYFALPQWWDGFFAGDFIKFGSLCLSIKENNFRTACFLGIGNIAPHSTKHDPEKISEICALMPDYKFRATCIGGAVRILVNIPEEVPFARKVCADLPEALIEKCLKRTNLSDFY